MAWHGTTGNRSLCCNQRRRHASTPLAPIFRRHPIPFAFGISPGPGETKGAGGKEEAAPPAMHACMDGPWRGWHDVTDAFAPVVECHAHAHACSFLLGFVPPAFRPWVLLMYRAICYARPRSSGCGHPHPVSLGGGWDDLSLDFITEKYQ